MYAKHVTGKKERFQITKSPQGNLKIIASDVNINRNPAEEDSKTILQDERTESEGRFHYFVLIHSSIYHLVETALNSELQKNMFTYGV